MLKKALMAATVLGLVACLPGCKSKQESLADEMVSVMQDIADALKTVKDKESAETAATRIKELAKRGSEIGKEYKDLEKTLSKEERKQMDDTYEPKVEAVGKQIEAEMTRIAKEVKDPAALMALGSAMAGMK